MLPKLPDFAIAQIVAVFHRGKTGLGKKNKLMPCILFYFILHYSSLYCSK
jgi:hypothetical protein